MKRATWATFTRAWDLLAIAIGVTQDWKPPSYQALKHVVDVNLQWRSQLREDLSKLWERM